MSPECQVLQQENLTLVVDGWMYGVPFALTCGSCGEPMVPNLSQAHADGCLWICVNPDCPTLCAGELETEDLVEGGAAAQLIAARRTRTCVAGVPRAGSIDVAKELADMKPDDVSRTPDALRVGA
jgi:hypothetical protein